MLQQSLRRLRLRHKTSAWTFGSLAGGRFLAGEEQLGGCTAKHSKYYRLYLHSDKVTLAAMYLRRVRAVGRSFTAALTHISKSLRRLRLQQKISAWVFGGPAGGILARPATPR
jgi:hypothetical protein